MKGHPSFIPRSNLRTRLGVFSLHFWEHETVTFKKWFICFLLSKFLGTVHVHVKGMASWMPSPCFTLILFNYCCTIGGVGWVRAQTTTRSGQKWCQQVVQTVRAKSEFVLPHTRLTQTVTSRRCVASQSAYCVAPQSLTSGSVYIAVAEIHNAYIYALYCSYAFFIFFWTWHCMMYKFNTHNLAAACMQYVVYQTWPPSCNIPTCLVPCNSRHAHSLYPVELSV